MVELVLALWHFRRIQIQALGPILFVCGISRKGNCLELNTGQKSQLGIYTLQQTWTVEPLA
jgi:hypothetical protein